MRAHGAATHGVPFEVANRRALQGGAAVRRVYLPDCHARQLARPLRRRPVPRGGGEGCRGIASSGIPVHAICIKTA